MLADVDIGQVIFVIVFLVVGFIQWVIKVLKEKAESAGRTRHVPTQEEERARREVWEQQTRPVPPTEPEPPASIGGTLGDLLGEFRKAMEEAQRPSAPPPLPEMPHRSLPSPPPLETRPVHVAENAPSTDTGPSVVTTLQPIRAARRPHPFTSLLHTPEGYRQAFVLREVLGPPRAFLEHRGPDD